MILEFSPFLTVDVRLIWDAVPVVQQEVASADGNYFQWFFFPRMLYDCCFSKELACCSARI